MKEQDNNLDEKISKSINGGRVEFDFESWKSKNPEAVKALQAVPASSAKSTTKKLNLWRMIMRSRIIKLAAAAVIILVVIFGIPFFSSSGPSVSLAAVLGKMQLVNAFMYKVNMTTTGNMQPGMPSGPANIEATILISNEYGMKMDNNIEMPAMNMKMKQKVYVVPEDKSIYMFLPEQKTYVTMELDESWLDEINKESQDPRDVVKQVLKCKFTELGKSNIDGTEVEGFETTDPAYAGGLSADGDLKVTLWVDSQTWLPVRMEMYIKASEQLQMEGTMQDFAWDLQVDPGEFKPMIPDDYTTPLPGGIKIPGFSEEVALTALRNFAQAADKYPKNLNMLSLMQETMALRDSVLNEDTEEGKKRREEIAQMSQEERMRDGAEKMLPFQSLAMFYMKLVQDGKEPVYYGETVGPDDIDKILLRYKTGKNEYRVIYGDLSAETVDGDVLAELESQTEH